MGKNLGNLRWSNRIVAFFIAAALVFSCLPTAGWQVQAKEGDADASQAQGVYDISYDETSIWKEEEWNEND